MSPRGGSTECLSMGLNGKRVGCLQSKLPYFNHRLPPWLTGDAPRVRWNRWLGSITQAPSAALPPPRAGSVLGRRERVV